VPFVRACPLQDGFVRRSAVISLWTRKIPIEPELNYSEVLKRSDKNCQHDDNYHNHDDREEGASQQRPKHGDVTLVGEPVSSLAFLIS